MNYFFHPEAEAEFVASIEHYEECEPGLGVDFAVEVHSTISRIVQHSQAWPILKDELRRCQTSRFPYGVIYSVQDDGRILILAVMHLHREPDYWKDRK